MKINLRFTSIVIVLLIVCSISFVIYKYANNKSDIDSLQSVNKITNSSYFPVKIQKVIKGNLDEYLFSNGVVKSEKDIYLVNELAGKISKTFVKEGDWVNKGDTILTIDNEKYKIEFDEAKDKFLEARVEYGMLSKTALFDSLENKDAIKWKAEIENLNEQYYKKEISNNEYQKKKAEYEEKLLFSGAMRTDLMLSKSGYNKAKNALTRAKINLDNCVIKAPFNGVVNSINYVNGQYCEVNSNVVRLIDVADLYVESEIIESECNKVRINNKAFLIFPSLEDLELEGTISFVNSIVDPEKKTCKIKVKVLNNAQRVKPGIYTNIKLVTSTKNDCLLIPNDAILERNNKCVVFSCQNGVAYWHYIKKGKSNDQYSEVLAGINLSDNVIISGHELLNNLVKVKVEN